MSFFGLKRTINWHRGDLQPVSPSNAYKHSLNHNYTKFHASTQFNESVSHVKAPKMSVFDLKWPKMGHRGDLQPVSPSNFS